MTPDQRSDDLTGCHRNPLHTSAAIQSFGGLIAADAGGNIVQMSAHIAALFGLAEASAPGSAGSSPRLRLAS